MLIIIYLKFLKNNSSYLIIVLVNKFLQKYNKIYLQFINIYFLK